jgi:hypothetical protein
MEVRAISQILPHINGDVPALSVLEVGRMDG